MRQRRGFWTDERGSALVEVAFSLPLLLVILAGTVDFGLYEERKMQVVEAANAAAGYGAQGGNQLNLNGMQTAAANASPSLRGLQVSASSLWTCTPGGTAVSSSSTCNNSNNDAPLQYVVVTTSAVIGAPVPLASLGSSITVTGQATYRVRWKPS